VIGYHYTSWENWERIQREGLIPYTLTTPPEVAGERAVWVFAEPFYGEADQWQATYTMTRHRTLKAVRLRVRYPRKDELDYHIRHQGTVGGWAFHRDAPARLVGRRIPPCSITLDRVYELTQRMAA
jgi:hypothetical protein